MTEILLLTGRGVLHKGVSNNGARMTDERCNLDQSEVMIVGDRSAAKRLCKRCFPT